MSICVVVVLPFKVVSGIRRRSTERSIWRKSIPLYGVARSVADQSTYAEVIGFSLTGKVLKSSHTAIISQIADVNGSGGSLGKALRIVERDLRRMGGRPEKLDVS